MSGLMRRCSSYPRPQLCKTRELKFSITMSETAISRLTISRPFAVRTLRLMLFLLTFVSLKFPEVFRLTSRCRGVVVLGNRPRSFSGHSILMISAPKAPSQRVAHGPARTQLKSTTRVPARLFIWGGLGSHHQHQRRQRPERQRRKFTNRLQRMMLLHPLLQVYLAEKTSINLSASGH